MLHIANGEVLQRKLADKQGRIARLIAEKIDHNDAFELLYLTTISRLPTPQERAACNAIVKRAASAREGLKDILWALCNSREFLFVH